jgi:hypothetical protein
VFDGVNDFVNLPSFNISQTKFFTFESWIISPISPPVGLWFVIFSEALRTGKTLILTAVFDSGYVGIFARDASSVANQANGLSYICDGKIHHHISRCDGINFQTLVDNIPGPLAPITVGSLVTNSTQIGNFWVNNYNFQGPIMLVRVYPFPLTNTEIAQNFAAGPQASAGVWGDGVTPGAVLELVAAYGNAFVGG